MLRANQTISGQSGRITATIDGEVILLAYAKSIDAKITKRKTEFKTLGTTGTQHKSNGWSGTGTLVLYYATSRFRQIAIDYIKNGKDTYFNLTVDNEDSTSILGTQTTVLYDCNFDEMTIAKLDVDSDMLDEELPFTFSDADLLNNFNE